MRTDNLYAILLRLYPSDFREEYGREMRAAFRRQRRDATGIFRQLLLWLSLFADIVTTAAEEHFHIFLDDLRYCVRSLRQTRSFTFAVLITIALGIGATTAIYTLVHAVLLRPLPFNDADHLVRIVEINQPLGISEFAASVPNFLSWQKQSRAFQSLAAIQNGSVNLTSDGEPQRVVSNAVTQDFWKITGIQPVAGRAFLPEDYATRPNGVVMLSEGLWRQRYGSDPTLIGRTIIVNTTPRIVLGIAPQDVGYTRRVDLWAPLVPNPAEEDRGNHHITVVGRLRSTMTVAAADAELNGIAQRLDKEFPKSNLDWRVRLILAKDWIVNRDTRTSLFVLLAAVVLLLLTTCANVAGLLVTRATARTHEFGVRLALGARRRRLVRQLTTESLVLALIGGTLGVLIGTVAVKWLATRVTNQLPRAMNITVDWAVLVFAFGLIVAIGFVFGLAPSWSTRHVDVVTPLRRGGRGTVGTTGARLRLALAGGQVALATILLVGALLLIQSLARLQEVDLGFQPDHLLTASLNLPIAKYSNPEKAEAFYRNLISEIKALPGVVNAGLTSAIPMSGGNTSMAIVPVDRPANVPERGIEASWRWVNADYLRTLRVPLQRGRLFEDTEWKLQSIVLSETLARLLWPDGSDPIGRQVKLVNGSEYTVGAVVGDVRMIDRREEPEPAMYFSPFFFETLTVVARTTGHPAELTHALRDAVHRIDPEQPVFNIRTMDDVLAANAERSRLETTLLTAFACLALLLGAVGIAGVVAYTVERSAPDLAVRLVLGATPVAAMRSAAQGALHASVIGLIIGLFAASSLSGLLSNVLYGVKPNDAATFAAVGISMFFVALLACWIPARRVSCIDPAAALKRE